MKQYESTVREKEDEVTNSKQPEFANKDQPKFADGIGDGVGRSLPSDSDIATKE